MKKKHIIGWTKWIDPFENIPNIPTKKGGGGYEDEDEYNVFDQPEMQIKNMTPMVMTPVGLMPIGDDIRPGKNFNFWIAHTTFRITPYIKDIIENTDGVETLDIPTPYRMRIGIGTMFNSPDVKCSIERRLRKYLQGRETLKDDIS